MPMRLHRHPLSGHCHRVELFLDLLGLPYEKIDVDLGAGGQRRAAFLALNPFGQVPVLEDDGFVLADSTAILVYLATKHGGGRWLPRDPEGAGRVQRWLSQASGDLAFGPAAARLAKVFGAPVDLEAAHATAHRLLGRLEQHLATSGFLAGAEPTIADVALYAYTAHAPEGQVALDDYPRVREWLGRVEGLPGFVPMRRTAVAVPPRQAAPGEVSGA
jgi:glutathione S-transferase